MSQTVDTMMIVLSCLIKSMFLYPAKPPALSDGKKIMYDELVVRTAPMSACIDLDALILNETVFDIHTKKTVQAVRTINPDSYRSIGQYQAAQEFLAIT